MDFRCYCSLLGARYVNKVRKWLQKAFCVPSVWYRNVFGILVRQNGACFSKLASAKLQREKGESKFFANLWRFEMLKSAHSPSVYGGKFIFFVAQKCADFQRAIFAKVTVGRILTIEGEKVEKVSRWPPQKTDRVTQKWPKKVTFRRA